MSRNEQPDDDTMRAILSIMDGDADDQGKKPEIASQDAAVGAPDAGLPPAASPPHLRVVSSNPPDEPAPDDAAAEPASANPVELAPKARRPRFRLRPRRAEPAPAAPDADDAVAAAMAESISPQEAEVPPSAPRESRIRLMRMAAAAGWARWRPLRPFLVATLAPVPFLLLAGAFGGLMSLLALLWMTGVLYGIDEILKRRGVAGPDPLHTDMADRLSVMLASLHFILLIFAVWVLSGATGLGFFSWIATFLAFGLWFGQVSNSNAHELIHRSDNRLFRLGMWVYISMLFGHHTSAHRLVHHRFVATTDDPNTAAEGENFWLFAARAWPGALVAGYEMEEHRREKREGGGIAGMNPYTIYVAGALGCVAVMVTLFGFDGLLAYLLLCAHAQLQLLLSDYVQHYGLLRRKLPSGTLEPAGAQHSWDAPHPFSGLMMLNAPRHADHHAHPSRPYPELRLSPGGQAPILPYSLPVMATIALVPPVWYRVMDRRLAKIRKAA